MGTGSQNREVHGNTDSDFLTILTLSSVGGAGHTQLRISGAEILMQHRGIDQNTISAHHKVKYTIRVADGTTRELIQSDNHSMWLQHQQGQKNREFFQELLDSTKHGGQASATVVALEELPHSVTKRIQF